MRKRSKTKVQLYLLIGLVVLLLFVLIRSGDQEAKIRTLDQRQVKQGEEFQKELDKRFDKLEKDIQQLKKAKVLSTTKTSQTATIQPPQQPAVHLSSSCEKYRSLVAQYNWDINTAMRIMNSESGCSPTGHNWTDTHRNWQTGQIICYGSWGLFNIGCVHGYSRVYLENPASNVAVAYKLYTNSKGFYPWTTY